MTRRTTRPRRGVAAVEMALVTLVFVVPCLIGLWEVGRMIQVQQIVSNSAREGARLASQAVTINSDGQVTQIRTAAGSPNVKTTVVNYLKSCGLTNLTDADVTVTFKFAPATGKTEPYQGLKGQTFEVYVSIPWDKVRWVNLGLVNPTKVEFTATWRMLVDDKFTVNDALPNW